ncbi:hypothetical protein OpiT1DRAFT_04104 [Opitutaceae bacterium TAV1]|nr:hypothetical protein OpiT1DRAFT_04104 [Opitutaceae bacterium TAV1]
MRSPENVRELTSAAPVQTDVFVSGTDGCAGYRIPSVIRAPNGDLLAFAEARKNGLGDTGAIELVLKRSTDGGFSWGATEIVCHDGDNTCGNPCLVLDETTGILHLLLTHNNGADHERDIIAKTSRGTRTVWHIQSTNHGKTWTIPRDITAAAKDPAWGWYATGPGVGVQLRHGPRKGRLVVPCNHSYDISGSANARGFGAHAIFSDDCGVTWQLSAPVRPVANESQLVELSAPAGALLMNSRRDYGLPSNEQNLRGVSTSFDGGATWSSPAPAPALIEPVCQGAILRHNWPANGQPGLILFSNPASKTDRERMTVRFSWNDAQTWPLSLRLHNGFSAYSGLVSISETEAGCLYETGGGDPKDSGAPYQKIVFARFPVPRPSSGCLS